MCHLSLCFGHWPQDNVFCHLQLHGESIARGMDHLLCTLSGKPGDCSCVVAYVNIPGAMWYCLGGVVDCVRAWFVTYAHTAMVALVMAICSCCVLTFCSYSVDNNT